MHMRASLAKSRASRSTGISRSTCGSVSWLLIGGYALSGHRSMMGRLSGGGLAAPVEALGEVGDEESKSDVEFVQASEAAVPSFPGAGFEVAGQFRNRGGLGGVR